MLSARQRARRDRDRLVMSVPFTTIRPEVRRRKTCHHIAGYLRYPGGVFSVTKYFPNQALFAGDTPQCIGHTVQLSMTPNGGNVIIRNGSKRITLKRDAVVMFVNVDDTAMNLANTHFHHYYHAIYEGDGSGKVPHLPSDAQPQDCELAKPSQLFPDTDCSNSHEP